MIYVHMAIINPLLVNNDRFNYASRCCIFDNEKNLQKKECYRSRAIALNSLKSISDSGSRNPQSILVLILHSGSSRK